MADYKVIGTSQKRYDAVEKVTGAAIYSGDIKPTACATDALSQARMRTPTY